MKKLFLLLLLPVVALGQPVNPIISGGTGTGGSGGSATNIGVSTSGGLLTTSTNGTGDFTIVLTPAVVGAVTSSNALYAVMAQIYTNAIEVRISSRGIANGLSAIANDGANFGPDTAGTTTMGIQEAWNAFNKGTNYGPLIAPMVMKFTDGFFYYTNRIVISNLFTSAIMWKGDSMLGSTLVYAGTTATTNTILFNSGSNTNAGSLSLPLHIQMENLTFTALTNSTNVLLELKGFSYANLQHLNFTSWNVRTNQGTGSGVSMFGTAATQAPGLVGLYLNNGSLEHAVVLNDIFFAGLACGMRANSDHVEATGIRGAQISYVSGSTATNIWPSTNIYSLGACVIREGGYNSSWRGLHIYSTKVGFAAIGNGDAPMLDSVHFEGCDYPVVSDKVNIAPVVRDPRNVSGTLESFFTYKVFTPTSGSYTSTNGIYAPTFQDHPAAVAYGSWPYVNGSDYYRFFVFLTNTPSFWVDGNGVMHGDGSALSGIASTSGLTNVESRGVVFTNGLVVAKGNNTNFTVATDGVLVSDLYFGIATDYILANGSASLQGGTTLFQPNGNVDLVGGALHVEPTKVVLVTGVTGYGNGAGFTNIPPTTGIAGWPANSAGVLQNNGSGTLSWGNPAGGSVTLTNTTSAAGLVVGGSGSYGIGTNLTSVAGGTNQFWIAASPPNEKYTNLFGDTMEISGAYRVLTVGTNVGNNVQISDGISSFPNGMWIDAGAQEYFVGKISVGTSRGQFQLGSGAVSNLTATGVIYAPSNNITGGISAGSLTATNYNFLTNGNNIGTIMVGQVLYTNITGNVTLGGFSGVTAGYNQWAKVIATNSTATDYKITLAASVMTSTNAFVVGQDVWVTNKSKVHIVFDIGPDTNAAAVRFQR